jgi:hypothetical protein
MRVKHDALLDVIVRSGGQVLSQAQVPANQLDAHLIVQGFTYNSAPYSGGAQWWDPSSGLAIQRPKVTYTLINPDDELTGDQECYCNEECGGSA